MRALKRTREVSSRLDGSVESLLAQFSATTIELNPSLGPAEFARRLTGRAVEMLNARAAVLAVGHGNEWEIAAISGPALPASPIRSAPTANKVAHAIPNRSSVRAVSNKVVLSVFTIHFPRALMRLHALSVV